MTRSTMCSGLVLRKRVLQLVVVIVAIAAHSAFAEEAEEINVAGVSMAATLLGSISFIMTLFYFTNWPDPDIKQYSWEIISSTISIFCAVLGFSCFNDLMEAYVIDRYHLDPFQTWVADILHMLFWFTCLQGLLAYFSGAITMDFDLIKDNKEELEEELEGRELNMKCYATLMAHLTGFASINAWGQMQQLPTFRQTPLMAMGAVPLAWLGQLTLQRITAWIRERVCMGDDGEKDPFEEMWDDETEEAENDVMGLTISFMTVNAWRYCIIGCLPNNEGKEKPPACRPDDFYHHSDYEKALLWGSAFIFTMCVFTMHYTIPAVFKRSFLPGIPAKLAERIVWVLATGVSMCFSWCTFYGVQMCLASFGLFKGEDELLSVVLALLCSMGVFACMIPLDWLADQDWTDDRCDEGIRATMDAFALLVGFAWEQCFDESVDSLAQSTQGWRYLNPHSAKFLLSTFCAGLLVPAWKWYMLPFIMKKGWRFDPIGCPRDLQTVFEIMRDEEKEETEKAEAEGKKNEEDSECHTVLRRLHTKHIGGTPGYVPPKIPNDALHDSRNISDDPAQMRRLIIDLQVALNRAENERDNAQNMVAYQMEEMLANMKKLNLTVTRIP